MTEIDTYHTFVRQINFLLKIAGIQPLQRKINKLGMVYVGCVGATALYMSCFIFNFCIHNTSSIAILTKGLSPSGSYFTVFLKVLCCYKYRTHLQDLKTLIVDTFHEELNHPELCNIVLSSVRYFKSFVSFFVGLIFTATLSYTLVPILAYFKYQKYVLFMPTRYPWNFVPGDGLYWLTYTIEGFSLLCLFSVTVSVDALFCFYAFHICGKLKALSYNFANLQFDDMAVAKFHRFIFKHQLIITQAKALQKTFGPIIIWTYVTSALLICAMVYQLFQVKPITVIILFRVTFYIMAKLVQTFVYAWCGNLMTQESDVCLKSPFNSNWTDFGKKLIVKDMIMVIMQRNIILKVMGFFVVSIEAFTAIINGAVSYFFLLQTLEE